ncbi:hypothetical protein DTO166G4_6922 [Paecilomyces variotii]|nr:hypothetical protein DTO166G4_6922 [Paecilomyces variotii]KAJ9232097.1 hypothetical protein DTO166G5_6425 [Paecilomyces variotii]KAJ9301112.1 hypothetical protein DTO217A2_7683 [Paecilomyces variotii]KAJ9408948.1 hypothetical protein DTO045G8_3123 [Paecilomyces variotii]
MRYLPVLVASLVASVAAAPSNIVRNNVYGYSAELAEFYTRVSHYIGEIRQASTASPTCDTSKIALPAQASGLPAPPAGQKVLHVAVGRGTQNYTCADSTANTKPVAIGALASLYNATCVAANYPDLMSMAPNVVINIALPTKSSSTLPPANLELLGHHFFRDTTTPVFNLDTTPERQYGIAISKKNASMSAPTDAVKGQHNTGNGAVAWLYLDTINGTVGDYKSVYRVNTAGGNPPATCEGMGKTFTVQYSADYYFYG